MGTRSLTIFVDEHEKEIVVMYCQYDGYPEHHGMELASFLSGMKIVNGIPLPVEKNKIANGMSCLSAQVVAKFKNQAGYTYLYPAGTRNAGEEWLYTVYGKIGYEVRISVTEAYEGKVVFDGTASDMLVWINETRK